MPFRSTHKNALFTIPKSPFTIQLLQSMQSYFLHLQSLEWTRSKWQVIAGSIVAPGFQGALGHNSRSHNTRVAGFGSSAFAGFHRSHTPPDASSAAPAAAAGTTTTTSTTTTMPPNLDTPAMSPTMMPTTTYTTTTEHRTDSPELHNFLAGNQTNVQQNWFAI